MLLFISHSALTYSWQKACPDHNICKTLNDNNLLTTNYFADIISWIRLAIFTFQNCVFYTTRIIVINWEENWIHPLVYLILSQRPLSFIGQFFDTFAGNFFFSFHESFGLSVGVLDWNRNQMNHHLITW